MLANGMDVSNIPIDVIVVLYLHCPSFVLIDMAPFTHALNNSCRNNIIQSQHVMLFVVTRVAETAVHTP